MLGLKSSEFMLDTFTNFCASNHPSVLSFACTSTLTVTFPLFLTTVSAKAVMGVTILLTIISVDMNIEVNFLLYNTAITFFLNY